jgi:hypothetical protein
LTEEHKEKLRQGRIKAREARESARDAQTVSRETPPEPEPLKAADAGAMEAEEDTAPAVANEKVSPGAQDDDDPPFVTPPSADDLKAEFAALSAKAKAAGVDIATVTGFDDSYDRRERGLREAVHERAHSSGLGATREEIYARNLDRTRVKALTHRGREFLRAHHLKWVNRTLSDGVRVTSHRGEGFFVLRPSKWAADLMPVSGVKLDDTWVMKDLLLMAETIDNYRKHLEEVEYERRRKEGGIEWREQVKDDINRAARESPGGKIFAHKNVAFDELIEGPPIEGPDPKSLPL